MERLVAQIFRSNFSHAEVIHIGRPGDRGIDVMFVDSEGSTWLIQVKRRSKAGAVEGFETLQKLLGNLALEGENKGIIVSNASHFSVQAKQQALRVAQRGMTVKLWDRGVLNRMLGTMLPERPWRTLLRELEIPIRLEERFVREFSPRAATISPALQQLLLWQS
jgi:Restriction endonuclease